MPPGFLNSKNYVGVTLRNLTGTSATPPAACGTCLPFQTDVTIPLAGTFTNTGPFYNGTSSQAYTWSVVVPGALLPSNFKPTTLWHAGADGSGYVPNCQFDTNGNVVWVTDPPSPTPGLCLTSVTQAKKTKDVTYSGIGVNNGSNWPG